MTFVVQFKRFRRGVPEDPNAARRHDRRCRGFGVRQEPRRDAALARSSRRSARDGRSRPYAARLDRAGGDRAALPSGGGHAIRGSNRARPANS